MLFWRIFFFWRGCWLIFRWEFDFSGWDLVRGLFLVGNWIFFCGDRWDLQLFCFWRVFLGPFWASLGPGTATATPQRATATIDSNDHKNKKNSNTSNRSSNIDSVPTAAAALLDAASFGALCWERAFLLTCSWGGTLIFSTTAAAVCGATAFGAAFFGEICWERSGFSYPKASNPKS